jgi:hypothetical protein
MEVTFLADVTARGQVEYTKLSRRDALENLGDGQLMSPSSATVAPHVAGV